MESNQALSPASSRPEDLVERNAIYEETHEPLSEVSDKLIRDEEEQPKHADDDHHGYAGFEAVV
ncbi:MAG: hypothetical protein HC890_01220 [Chloroflexaceae bacterium]|nr:hypothetical protein [Chloroflexaceae bacterium]